MRTDIIMLTKAANGLVYRAVSKLALHSRDSIDKLIVCYTGNDANEFKKLKDFLDNIKLNTQLLQDEYNFAKLNNKIMKQHVTSENILFMNDDVILHSDAVTPCLKVLEDKAFGAVGIKLVYPNDTIQHAGVFQACNNLGVCHGVGHIHFKEKNRAVPPYIVPGVTGAFLMMRTADFKKIGGFDEHFKHCFEDVVLCKRIRDLGMQIVCNNVVEATHYESQTRKQAMCREDFDLVLSILNEKLEDKRWTRMNQQITLEQ